MATFTLRNSFFKLKILFVMSKIMYDYTKSVLERVSFDPILFCKELEKAIRTLLPYEIEQLREWLLKFTFEKPELKQCLLIVNA
jgi:DNA replication protein DnaD